MTDFTSILPIDTWLVVLEFLAVPVPRHYVLGICQGRSIILRSSPDIRAMATLSRFFYQLADPFRFREAHFAVDYLEDPIKKYHRITELLDLLDRRPEVKSWIRNLSIGRDKEVQGSERDDVDVDYIAVDRRIHKAIGELRGLSELRCREMVFTPTFLSAILQLPQLYDLQLNYSQVLQGPTDSTPDWSAVRRDRSSLRRLTVSNLKSPFMRTTVAEALVHLLRLETLAELNHVSQPTVVSLTVPSGLDSLVSIISDRIPDYVFKGLRKLNIVLNSTDAEVQGFVHLGTRCPNLVSLTIRWGHVATRYSIGNQLRHRCLKEHPFPALQEFGGQLALASIFVPGRPVHSVDCLSLIVITDDHEGPIVISNIAALRPTVPLRVFRFTTAYGEWDETYIETVAQHHPELEELVCNHPGPGQIGWTARLEVALGKLAKLQRLSLNYTGLGVGIWTGKLGDDHEVIVKLRSSCPNLQRANLYWLGIWTLSS